MPEDVLKSCKKCVVKSVVNPGLFLMIDCQDARLYKNKRRELEELIAKDVVRFRGLETESLAIGQIIAVEDEKGFHRGLVTDVYKKKLMKTFEVFLFDHGRVVEANQKNIGLIRSDELKKRQLGTFEVLLHGVRPVTLEINDASYLGVFQKRVCTTWSPAAFQLVEKQFQMNPIVYVKCIQSQDTTVTGEIYLMKEPGAEPLSLGELLCQKGYAIKLLGGQQLSSETLDMSFEEIAMKIPERALSKQFKNLTASKKYNRL